MWYFFYDMWLPQDKIQYEAKQSLFQNLISWICNGHAKSIYVSSLNLNLLLSWERFLETGLHNTKSKFPLKQVFVISKPGILTNYIRHTCYCTYQLPSVRNWKIVISSRFSEHDLKAKWPLFKVHKRNFVTLI